MASDMPITLIPRVRGALRPLSVPHERLEWEAPPVSPPNGPCASTLRTSPAGPPPQPPALLPRASLLRKWEFVACFPSRPLVHVHARCCRGLERLKRAICSRAEYRAALHQAVQEFTEVSRHASAVSIAARKYAQDVREATSACDQQCCRRARDTCLF